MKETTPMKSSLFRYLTRLTVLLFLISEPRWITANTYQLDDGTGEIGFGNVNGGDLIALNEFTVTPGNDLISSISIAWGNTGYSGINGLSYKAVLWEDTSGVGNPSGAQLLGTIPNNTVSGSGTNTFLTSTFASPILVPTQHFFVGFILTNPIFQNPAAVDNSSPFMNRSYFAFNNAGMGDISNLTNNPGGVRTETFGNFLIRADAVPEPSTWAMIVLGAVILTGFARRRRMA